LYQYAREWVKACDTCTKHKTPAPLNHGLLIPIVTTRPFQIVAIDLVGPLQVSSTKNKYILVCIDLFTSWVEATPLKAMTAEEVIKSFFQIVVSRHGCPESVLSDQGTQFMSSSFEALCTSFNMKHLKTTAYHHQCNGKVERFIRFLKNSLATITPSNNLNKWDQLIDHCLFIYRISINRTLNDTPFFLLYGRDAILPQVIALNLPASNKRTIQETEKTNYQWLLVRQLKVAYGKLIAQKEKEQAKYKCYYDKSHKEVDFNVGDNVFILFDAPIKGFLMPRWEGPYTIIRKIDPVTYRVQNESRNFAVHVQRMILRHKSLDGN
jgi:hypothetical protein